MIGERERKEGEREGGKRECSCVSICLCAQAEGGRKIYGIIYGGKTCKDGDTLSAHNIVDGTLVSYNPLAPGKVDIGEFGHHIGLPGSEYLLSSESVEHTLALKQDASSS